MLVQKPALRLYFLPFSQRNVLSFGGFFKVRMGERSVRIREVKGSNPSRSTFSSSVILTLLLFFCVHISHTLALRPGGIRTARPCCRQGKHFALLQFHLAAVFSCHAFNIQSVLSARLLVPQAIRTSPVPRTISRRSEAVLIFCFFAGSPILYPVI